MKRKKRAASECKYHDFQKSDNRVELWMKERLKHQGLPPCMTKAREKLQYALKTIEAKAGQIIEAKYVSKEARGRFFDVENVLFYNVRVGNFEKSSRHGLRFRYLDEEPPQPPESSAYFPHYQSYELVKKATPFLNQYNSVASYEFGLPPFQKPELNDVWWGSVNAEWNLNAERKLKLNRGEALERFAVRVDARYPQLKGEYAVRRVKKVFDGIASAMHFWKNPHEKLVRKVVSHLKVSSKSVREKFQVNEHALLGERHSSPNWNPADDRCIAGELLLTPNTEDKWRFKVEILAVG